MTFTHSQIQVTKFFHLQQRHVQNSHLDSNFLWERCEGSLIPDTVAFPVTGVAVVIKEATLTTLEVAVLFTTDEVDWLWLTQIWCCCPGVFAAGVPEDDELEAALSVCCRGK